MIVSVKFISCDLSFNSQAKSMQAKFNAKEHFSARLSQAIEKDGRSKTAIAESIGVQPQALSRWLSGVIPDASNLTKTANALGVSVQWLLTDETQEIHPRAREMAAHYKFTARSPFPLPSKAADLQAGCIALLNAMSHASSVEAFDYAVMGFEDAWAKFKEMKYSELNQIKP